jgi:hypothetical protein
MPSDTFAPLLTRRAILGVAAETTSGVAATVTQAAADTTVLNVSLSPAEFTTDGERRPIGTSLGKIDSNIGKRIGELSFRTAMRHSDATLTLLRGCGFTVSGSTATPTSDMSSRDTLTFKVWEDGRLKSIVGASGNCSITVANGGIAYADWTFSGVWQAPTDNALPATAAVNSQSYVGSGLAIQLASTNIPAVGNVTINLNNQVEPREDISATGGIGYFVVTDRGPTFELDTEARLIANYNAYGLLLAATTAAFSFALASGTNTLTIEAPRAQRVEMSDGDRGGKRTDNTVFQCSVDDTDDEITFTES